MVLLLGLSNDRAEQMNQEAMEGEESMFYSMEKWSPKLRAGQRLTWVQCWGVPLIASEKKYIQQIVAAMGDVADVDDDVEESRRVDRTRVLIRTPWSPAIQHTVYVNIGGGGRVQGACCGGNPPWYRKLHLSAKEGYLVVGGDRLRRQLLRYTAGSFVSQVTRRWRQPTVPDDSQHGGL